MCGISQVAQKTRVTFNSFPSRLLIFFQRSLTVLRQEEKEKKKLLDMSFFPSVLKKMRNLFHVSFFAFHTT